MKFKMPTKLPKKLKITEDVSAQTPQEFFEAIVSLSDEQVTDKNIFNDEERLDFLMACDAFNFSRFRWRLEEEFCDEKLYLLVLSRVSKLICGHREYSEDDFGLAIEATADRAKFPLGLAPLEFALQLANKNPIRMIDPESCDPLSVLILSMALQLQEMNGKPYVLLPIELLRKVLACRKLTAGGAVKRLLRLELLRELPGTKAHTGVARRFMVCAKEGKDYAFVTKQTAPSSPFVEGNSER